MGPKRKILSDQSGCFELIKPKKFSYSPVISIVMSVCNGEKYLPESIDSILRQTYENFEFIIINDGSSDDTLDILLGYQAKDNRILIVNQKNIGLTPSLNRAVRLAVCEYIARQDADDISTPSRLEKQLNYMKTYPKVAVVGCFGDVFNANGLLRTRKDHALSPANVKRRLVKKNLFMHGSAMMRKSSLAKVGFYREFFRCSQDYDLWLRLSRCFDIAILPEHLYQYRITPQAVSVSKSLTQKEYADVARQLHIERLTTGKDSYNTFLSSYPNGLHIREADDKYNYHIYMAKEFMGANKLNQARNELRKAWKLEKRKWPTAYLFLKTLLGTRLLNICREFRSFKLKIRHANSTR